MNSIDLSAWGDRPPMFVQLLAAEVRQTNRTAAGKRIGMSRTAVSLILVNRYASKSTAGVERRVMETLGRIDCAATEATVTIEQCQSYREKPAPTHNPYAMHGWRACQHCAHNPHCQKQENHDA